MAATAIATASKAPDAIQVADRRVLPGSHRAAREHTRTRWHQLAARAAIVLLVVLVMALTLLEISLRLASVSHGMLRRGTQDSQRALLALLIQLDPDSILVV
jgi:hypothetical protein